MVTRARWEATPYVDDDGVTHYITATSIRPHLARRKAIWQSEVLTSTERLVLQAIEDRADNVTGFAYPGVATIVEDTALSKRAVLLAIHSAAAKGWLNVMPGKSPLDARGNAYIVTPVAGDVRPKRVWLPPVTG